MDGGIEIEIPLMPTEEELREMRKEQTREKLQLLDGGKDTNNNDEE
ncbi:hypothetical protein [Paenibacillus lutimineralis]|nr:hypothetical protein [Paenibacillus lutimineralis]